IAGEDAHQIVFQRKEETGGAGIALASGAPAQQVIDAPRFVALRADDVQTAAIDYFLVLRLDDALGARQGLLPLRVVNLIRIDLVSLQKLASHEFGIAAEQ